MSEPQAQAADREKEAGYGRRATSFAAALSIGIVRNLVLYVIDRFLLGGSLIALVLGGVVIMVGAAIAAGLGWYVTNSVIGGRLEALDTALGIAWFGAFVVILFLGIRWLVMASGRLAARAVDRINHLVDPGPGPPGAPASAASGAPAPSRTELDGRLAHQDATARHER